MNKRTIMFWIVGLTLLLSAVDAVAMSGHGRRRGGAGSNSEGGSISATASVPEPSTLYAVGTGIALLGGAGWYIRRRK